MWKDTRASELAVGCISSSSPPIRMHILDKAGESGLAAERLKLGWGGLQRRQLNTSRTSTSTQKLPALHSPFHSFHPHHVCLRALSSSAQFPSSPPSLILPSSLTLLLVFLFFNFLLSRPSILLRFRARLRRGAEVVQSEHSGTSGVQHWDTVGAVSFPAWGPQRGRRIARKAWQ